MFIEPKKLGEAEPEALADLLNRRSASASGSIFLVDPTCESETTSIGERALGGEGLNRLVTPPAHLERRFTRYMAINRTAANHSEKDNGNCIYRPRLNFMILHRVSQNRPTLLLSIPKL